MDSKAAVPKFSSFKPRGVPSKGDAPSEPPSNASASLPSQPKPKEHHEHRSRSSRDGARRHKTRDRSRDRHQNRRETRHRSRERQRDKVYTEQSVRRDRETNAIPTKSNQPIATTSDWDDVERPYYIDRRGDASNVTYGGLYRHSIPPFHRAGGGCVLGLRTRQRIDRDLSFDRGIVLSEGGSLANQERKLLSKKYANCVGESKYVITGASPDDVETDHHSDFISVATSRKRKRGSNSPTASQDLIGTSRHAWRSNDSDEESPESSFDEHPAELSVADDVKRKNAELSRTTKERPKLLDGWLQLIEHQEKMVRLDHGTAYRRLTNAERRNIAEIRISMYEQALRSIGTDHANRVSLRLEMIKEGSKIWETAKVSEKWRHLLEEFPDMVDVWLKYLNFSQANFREFQLDPAREHYHHCLQTLSRLVEQAPQTGHSVSKLQRLQMYVIVRLTRLLSEAGYHEQSLAIWQAIIEFQFFGPGDVQDLPQLLSHFEEFWDSEIARVGELGASGWGNSHSSQSHPEGKQHAPSSEIGSASPLSDFYDLETAQMRSIERPGRTTDAAAEDDPYHAVLFSDISSYISILAKGLSVNVVIEAFLAFWDLPPVPRPVEAPFDLKDVFLRNGQIQHSPTPPLDTDESLSNFAMIVASMSRFPLMGGQTTTQALFDDAFDHWSHRRNIKFIGLVLRQVAALELSSLEDTEALCEYSLAFTAKFSPQEATAYAKQTLQRRPSSLRLYNAYALIEGNLGNRDVSRRVFSTAIRMSKKLPESAQVDVILLRNGSTWESLKRGDLSTARSGLLAIGNDEETALGTQENESALVISARNALIKARDERFASGDYARAILYTDCLAILLYLQSGQDISLAVEVYQDTHDTFTNLNFGTSSYNELIHEAQARLLSFHASQARSFKPALLRDTLSHSLRLFPDNTTFLSLFAANEARFRIDDRLRSLMDSISLQEAKSSIVSWMFAIFTEMRRGEYGGSTAHSVRATFERAVALPHIQHSSSLWTSYVLFEAGEATKTGTQEARERGKSVFFLGMVMLPWCKAYMLLAFSPQLAALQMSVADLRRVWDVMGEKQMRLFIDMDDVFERLGRGTQQKNIPDDPYSAGE